MKANMTTLSIYELRKTIGLWKSRKITDSTISKLLDLYLGVTAYMNAAWWRRSGKAVRSASFRTAMCME